MAKRLLTAGLCVAVFLASSSFAPIQPRTRLRVAEEGDLRIHITREYSGKKCTSGYLMVTEFHESPLGKAMRQQGKRVEIPEEWKEVLTVYALERPWADNKQNLSSIPTGSYSAHLRYDHTDLWRIELDNVPNRTNVQIHIGNTPNQTTGCILVGLKLDKDLCSLGDSATAYSRLEAAFYGSENPNYTPNRTITVSISGWTIP